MSVIKQYGILSLILFSLIMVMGCTTNEQSTDYYTVGGVSIKVERSVSGAVTVTNLETGLEIIKERGFWFAWYAFHPDTGLYLP